MFKMLKIGQKPLNWFIDSISSFVSHNQYNKLYSNKCNNSYIDIHHNNTIYYPFSFQIDNSSFVFYFIKNI